MDRNTPALGKNIHQVSPASKETALVVPPAAYPEVLGQFDYVHTRVVPLRAEHLERNRIVAYNKNSSTGAPRR